MITDYILIFFTIFIFVKYLILKNKLEKEHQYFYETLNNDLKVATIAQFRGLELLENNEIVEEIKKSCKYSIEMIETLVKIYKYEKNIFSLNYSEYNLKHVLKNILNSFSKNIKDKNIKIITNAQNTDRINCDKTEMSKVLKYLFDFSIKNCKNNQTIEIDFQKSENTQILKIKYYGKGLSNEEKERMFEKNPRFSTVGHGIKMYFCKKIINLHNGKIELESNKDSNIFKITIPAKSKKNIFSKRGYRKIQIFPANIIYE